MKKKLKIFVFLVSLPCATIFTASPWLPKKSIHVDKITKPIKKLLRKKTTTSTHSPKKFPTKSDFIQKIQRHSQLERKNARYLEERFNLSKVRIHFSTADLFKKYDKYQHSASVVVNQSQRETPLSQDEINEIIDEIFQMSPKIERNEIIILDSEGELIYKDPASK